MPNYQWDWNIQNAINGNWSIKKNGMHNVDDNREGKGFIFEGNTTKIVSIH